MKTKLLLFLFISFFLTSSYGQDNFKKISTLGKYFSEIDDNFGNYACKSNLNSFWYCFYGDDNNYNSVSTKIHFQFKNSRVSSVLFLWEHVSYSEAITDVDYEKNRLTKIYGRSEYKNGAYHFFTPRGLISCGYNSKNGRYESFINFTSTK